MRYYFNTIDGALSRSIFETTHTSTPQKVKRGDTENVEIIFHEAGTPVDLDPTGNAETLKFGAKVPSQQDGSYVFYSGSWTKSNGAVFTDAVTNSTATITSATAVFNSADEGKVITGAGIPSGTTIQAVVDSTTATLSQAATATATGVTITIRRRETVYTCVPSFNTTKGNNLLGFDPEGFAEVTEVRTIGGDFAGTGFKLFDAVGSVGVWINLDGGDTIPSQAAACARAIEISTIATGDTAAQKATKIAAVLNGDSAFESAIASGDLVTITDAAVGARTAAEDFTGGQASGYGVSTWIDGSAPNSMENVESYLLSAEVESVALGQRKSSQTLSLELDFDINQGNEGAPSNATPAYPDPDTLLTMNATTKALTSPTATQFRSANGLAIGTDVQAYDADLAAIAGLTSAANKGVYFTGSGAAATFDLSSFGRTLSGSSDASAARTTLGLVIGTNVQAYDAELAAIAGLTSAADKGIYFTGSGTAATFDLTSFGRTILGSSNKAALASAITNTVDYSAPPTATELMTQNLLDQVWPDDLTYEWIPNVTYAVEAEAGTGGKLLSGVGGQIWLKTGTDASSRKSWAYQIAHQLAFPGVDEFGQASFQKPMWASFKFQFQAAISTNGVFRCTVGHSTTNGALSVRGFGFLVDYNAANVGNLKAFAHDGSSLTTSAALATVATNNSKVHTVTLASDGLGTISVYLDGTPVGTVTGGPTSMGTGGNVVQEILNGADTTENAVLLTSIRTRVKKN